MNSRFRTIALGILVSVSILVACGSAEEPQNPLLELLSFVPDRPEYRTYVTYGDAKAWHASWGIPRVDSLEEVEALGEEPGGLWKSNLARQTTPPEFLDPVFSSFEDVRGFYGFDFYDLDRYLVAGMPRGWIVAVEFNGDRFQIANALTASGYEAERLGGEGTLYSILGDYQLSRDLPITMGQLGHLNRIVLRDGQMVIGAATEIVTDALAARSGASLADNARFRAAVDALEDGALQGTGELVGVIFMDGAQFVGPDAFTGSGDPELVEAALEEVRRAPPLPQYSLVAFATRHGGGASYLILAMVFPEGTDVAAAAGTLGERLKNYTSIYEGTSLRWRFDRATGVEAGGLPVALAVMRVVDPAPKPTDGSLWMSGVLPWSYLVERRDLVFLIAE